MKWWNVLFGAYLGNHSSGLILGLLSANERQCYIVTTPLIGWVQALNPDMLDIGLTPNAACFVAEYKMVT